jgi:hypothetical protein
VSAALTPMVIRWLLSRSKGSAERDGDAYVLRYGRGWATFIIVTGVLVVGLFVVLTFAVEGARAMTASIGALLAALFGFGIVDILKVAHRVDENGFERRTPWSPVVRIPWDEIVYVRYEPTARIFMRARTGAKLRVSVYLSGLGALARIILAHVPPDVLDARTRAGLADLAARDRTPGR